MIVALSKSVKSWKSVDDTNIHSKLIPSAERTILGTDTLDNKVEILIGFNAGDEFWEDADNRRKVMKNTFLDVSFISVVPYRVGQIPFNIVLSVALSYGADYFIRVNDDTEFISRGFVSIGISKLVGFDPPNVGVIGPHCIVSEGYVGNDIILTHDMVHKTHLQIFENYYPEQFDNWWIDDWISLVYGEERTQHVNAWEVQHNMHSHGTRYVVNFTQKERLNSVVVHGKKMIESYLKGRHRVQAAKHARRLGDVQIFDGPISRLAKISNSQLS